MNMKIAVLVFVLLVFLSAHVADAQRSEALLGLTLKSLEVCSTKDFDDVFPIATDSGAPAFTQRGNPKIGNERKRITELALKNRPQVSCLTGGNHTTDIGIATSIFPIENAGVIARSVTFPAVLNQGQGIIDTNYPNATLLCLDVAYYSGSVTGLIWSMDRELVEQYDLQHLIDRASMVVFTCAALFTPPEVLKNRVEQQMGRRLSNEPAATQNIIEVRFTNPDAALAVSPEIEEKTPAVSMENAKKRVLAQIEKIQEIIRFAQTVELKRDRDE